MRSWHHGPTHYLSNTGTYIVSAGTLGHLPLFEDEESRWMLHDELLGAADRYKWGLQAWSVFEDHHHFMAHSPGDARSLPQLIREVHARTAAEVNRRDGTPGRQVWCQYWDTLITSQRSFMARLAYVHGNAVRHGYVENATAYPWCSAAWFRERAPKSFADAVARFRTDRVKVWEPKGGNE